ncbi:CHAT domain-containing protein [Oscillatoria sp. FACHB-1406]|uniref:CHAT domain-containing protein n=1 Tax=Oscillatoria sp. FACHB-1406 TaxID=2692846 RepID=UPI0016835FFF|nr:CHAT domain-containing protein [Oscillatoria sp. FACHB-1406]MBD2579400.1 CHAT domain-containing protein [Oscillatoria sp. FACHB-1406]
MGLSKSVSGFNSLPNVPDELDGIVKTDDNDSKGVYAGSEYLNEAFDFRTLRNNLRGHQILHIATHGNFQPGRPEDSYLLLGTGDKLAIPEIAKLPALNDLHLVTLSACETALGGEGNDGVEINSISYYFLNQGAKAVLASLWLVNDASTAQLMQDFYQNLSQEMPITKAEALRQAQLKMLYSKASLNFSHPYYWSAFILIGNGF